MIVVSNIPGLSVPLDASYFTEYHELINNNAKNSFSTLGKNVIQDSIYFNTNIRIKTTTYDKRFYELEVRNTETGAIFIYDEIAFEKEAYVALAYDTDMECCYYYIGGKKLQAYGAITNKDIYRVLSNPIFPEPEAPTRMLKSALRSAPAEPESYTIATNGGGATHIATQTGLLSSLSSDLSKILIVSGGGGGGAIVNDAGNVTAIDGANAGGISGSGTNSGNQNSGYEFGQGQSGTSIVPGGGGGLYGGFNGFSWDGTEYPILWSGNNNKLTASWSSNTLYFKMYSGSTMIYSWSVIAINKDDLIKRIHASFIKDDVNYLGKPSFVYETSTGVYSYNQESPSDTQMTLIYWWLQGNTLANYMKLINGSDWYINTESSVPIADAWMLNYVSVPQYGGYFNGDPKNYTFFNPTFVSASTFDTFYINWSDYTTYISMYYNNNYINYKGKCCEKANVYITNNNNGTYTVTSDQKAAQKLYSYAWYYRYIGSFEANGKTVTRASYNANINNSDPFSLNYTDTLNNCLKWLACNVRNINLYIDGVLM